MTWEPDSYGFGDAAFWMQLHEEMRQAGFYIKTVEESCEHFAINCFIIKILRNIVVVFCLNCYHIRGRNDSDGYGYGCG